MTDRITAARLAEIERIHKGGIALMDSKIARWSAARGDIHNLADSALDAVTDLLAELREVTAERSEAMRERDEAQGWRTIAEQHCRNEEYWRNECDKLKADLESWHKGGRYLALEQERDKLKQELEQERKKHGYMAMAADEEAKLADEFNAECKALRAEVEQWKQSWKRDVDNCLAERNALRAENAKLRAVVDAAKLAMQVNPWPDQDAYQGAWDKLAEALAALDQPCTQGDPKEDA